MKQGHFRHAQKDIVCRSTSTRPFASPWRAIVFSLKKSPALNIFFLLFDHYALRLVLELVSRQRSQRSAPGRSNEGRCNRNRCGRPRGEIALERRTEAERIETHPLFLLVSIFTRYLSASSPSFSRAPYYVLLIFTALIVDQPFCCVITARSGGSVDVVQDLQIGMHCTERELEALRRRKKSANHRDLSASHPYWGGILVNFRKYIWLR